MQFLVITRQRTPAPPEMLSPMLGAMEAWIAQNRASGKAKDLWGFAGTIGGGGLLCIGHHAYHGDRRPEAAAGASGCFYA